MIMALPRFAKLDPAKKAMIIRVATEEFASRDYEQASLNRIIAQCQMSKGAFYYYFADKDDLFETVLDLFCRTMLDGWSGGMSEQIPAFSSCETPEGYWQEWVAHFRRSISHYLENPAEAGLFRRSLQTRQSGTSHPALNSVALRIREWIQEVLRHGQKIGAVRRDLPEELLIETSFGMMEGFDRWLAKELEGMPTGRTDELACLVVSFLMRIAEPEPV